MVDTATNQYYYFFYFSTVYSEYFYFCVEPPSLFLRPLQRWQLLYAELGHRVQRHQAHQKHLPDRQVPVLFVLHFAVSVAEPLRLWLLLRIWLLV